VELSAATRVSVRRLVPGSLAVAAIVLAASTLLAPGLAMAAAGLAGAAIVLWLAATVGARPRITAALLVVFLIATVLWQWLVISHQVSDFGVYLRCGRDFSLPWPGLEAWMRRCESQWLPGFATYWRRSLLYSLPIGWLFDGSYAGFKLANGLLHASAVIGLYLLVKRRFGMQAALLAAVVLAVYPEAWFVQTIVVSDNMVLPLLVLLLWLLATLAESHSTLRAAAVVGCVVALDLLRSIGPIVLLALLLLALMEQGRPRLRIFVLLGLCAMALALIEPVAASLGGSGVQHNGLLAVLLGNGIESSWPFIESYAWHQYVWPTLPAGARQDLTVGWLASELTHPLSLPQLWQHKLQVLFQGDGYYYYSSAARPLANHDDFDIAGAPASVPYNVASIYAMRGVVFAVLLAAALGVRRAVQTGLGRAAAAYVIAFIGFVVFLSETQPRYSVLLVPGLAVLVAGLCTKVRAVPVGEVLQGALGLVLAAVLGVALLTGWSHVVTARQPSLVWSAKSPACPAPVLDAVSSLRVVLKPAMPGCGIASVSLQGVQGPLEMYLLRQPVAGRWNRQPLPVLTLQLVEHKADGSKAWRELQLAGDRSIQPFILGAGTVAFDLALAPSAGADGVAVGYAHVQGRAIRMQKP